MLALLLAAQVALPQAAPRKPVLPPKQPPNVLIVLVDDLGVDQVGCYASQYPALVEPPCTPNIDSLAATGMRFTNAWSNPNCSPTRAALQTGRPARHTGVGTITGGAGLPGTNPGLQPEEPSLAKLLAHYASAAVGKWHLSDWTLGNSDRQHPIELGFDDYAGSLHNIDGAYDDWTKTLFPAGVELLHHGVYATVDTTDDALARIASLPEPWLLYVAYNGAHDPLHCPSDLGFAHGSGASGVCATDWCRDCPELLTSPTYSSYPPEVVQTRAVAHALDHEIGRLLTSADLSGTVVILASDNGTDKSAVVPPFPSPHAKGSVYQGGVNVPLIVRLPEGSAGECHELVQLTDVYATVADLAGVPLPEDPLRDSVSLMQYLDPGLASPGLEPRTHVYTEVFGPNFVPGPGGAPPFGYTAGVHHRAVRNATHKLIEQRWGTHGNGNCTVSVEFYQLASDPPQDPAHGPDPHEQNDLMLDPSSWSATTLDAFMELSGLLLETYPPLQVGDCP